LGIIAVVLEKHAEEAAFLWLLRDGAIASPHYSLIDLAKLDDRVEAHLDGLRLAGESGWEIAKSALLDLGEPGEVFTAAVLALESGAVDRVQTVWDAGTAKPEAPRGLISALAWVPYERVAPYIKSLLTAESPVLRRVGLAASARHRQNPGQALLAAFGSDDPLLGTQALRAAGELGLVDLHLSVRANLKAPEPPRRFWAAWSTVLLTGHRDGVAALQAIAETGGPFAERAAALAMRKLALPEARLWHKRLTQEPQRLRATIAGVGALGDPGAVPWLIEQMKAPALARIVGEAFCMITGADIAHDNLEGQKPEGFESGPTEDPADEDVAMDPDENLPWPDPQRVQKWWSERRGNFAKDTRHLLGRPITAESLQIALRQGYQRLRHAAAIELALLQPGKPLFEVRAPGPRQQALLK